MRPKETKNLLDFEQWVRSDKCDFCLDWTGNDLFDNSKTWDGWAVWEAAREVQIQEDNHFYDDILKAAEGRS